MDNDSIGEYELFDCVLDFAFLNNFFSNEIENNTTENNVTDHNSSLVSNASVSNTLDVMKHFDLNLEPHQKGETTARWIKRRRLKKGTEEYILRKREIKLQNRISARKSIEKKQAHIRELEAKALKLNEEIECRKRVIQIFPNSKPAGRLSGLRRAFSMSDFYLPIQVATEEANTTWGTNVESYENSS
ncbi:Basic-leucine zipper domain [Sesbania bispinosa]|nr:Basic-leucine zipper domain [Sesbania bispinosa]